MTTALATIQNASLDTSFWNRRGRTGSSPGLRRCWCAFILLLATGLGLQAAVAPLSPTNVVLANRTDTSLTISWTTPAIPNGGSAITGYNILIGGTQNSTVGNVTSATIAGLSREGTYVITLVTTDSAGGQSVASLPLSARTLGDTVAPSTPAAPVFGSSTQTSVTLSWTATADNVAIAGYDVLRNGVTVAEITTGTTCTDTGLTPGTSNSYAIRSYDAAGNRSSVGTSTSMSTQTDTAAPSAPTGLSVSGMTAASVSLSWTASTDNVGVVSYGIQRSGYGQIATTTGTTYVDTYYISPNSSYTYTVTARDAVGNVSATSSSVTATTALDTAAPTVPGIPYATSVGYTSVTLAWAPSTDNAAVSAYNVYRNGTLVGTPSGPSFTNSGLAAGTSYSYTISARDAAGNVSAVGAAGSAKTLADTVPPLPPSNLTIGARSDSSLTINWYSGSDAASGVVSYDVLVNGTLSTSVATTQVVLNGLTSSTAYTITVKSVDGAGLRSAASLPLTARTLVDTTAPTAPGTPTLVSNAATSITMQWTAAADTTGVAGYEVSRQGTVIGQVTSGLSFTDTGAAPNSSYSYYVRAFDAAGNRSSFGGGTVLATTADTTAPSVPTGVTITGTTAGSVSLSWTASTDNVGLKSYTVVRSGSQVGTTTATSFTDTQNVTASSTFSYTVFATDLAGNNSAASTAASATTPADTVAPSAPGTPYVPGPSYLTYTTATFYWAPSSDNVKVTSYDVYRNGAKLTTTTGVGFGDSSLVPGTAYTYYIIARDAAGNNSAASGSATFTTQADTVPPAAPTTLNVSGLTSTSLSLTWYGSSDVGSGNVTYVVKSGSTTLGTTTSTGLALSGLTANTTYSLTVVAKDAAGNQSPASIPYVVSTALTDTTAPATPAAPTFSSSTPLTITLHWTATTDNVGVAGYEILQGGIVVGQVASGLTYTDTGLLPGSNYSYTIRAYDAAGNRSAQSTNAVMSTQGDSIAPTAPSAVTVTGTTVASASLSWTAATDNVGVKTYLIQRSDYGQVGTTSATTYTDSLGMKASTAYTYSIYARDYSGNYSPISASVVATTAVDTVAPTKPGTPYAANPAIDVTFSSAALVWGPSTDNVAVTSYDVMRNGTKIASPTSNSYTDTTLGAGTTYAYTVVARDATGNASTASASFIVTVPADATPPLPPTNLNLYTRGDTTIYFSWNAGSDPVGSVVSYDILVGGTVTMNAPASTSSTTITSLVPATSYVITMKSVDSAGNRSVASVPLTVKTSVDVTAPAIPAIPTVTGTTATTASLQWSAVTDNVAVAGYQVLRSGYVVAQVTSGLTYTDSGLLPNSSYAYYIQAYDAAGNITASSPGVTATTVSDTTSPTAPTNLTVTGTTASSVSLSWTAATDNVGVKDYLLQRSGTGQVAVVTGTTYTDASGLAASTSYTYSLYARDFQGNYSPLSGSVIGTTTGDTIAPSVPGIPYPPNSSSIGFTTISLNWAPSTDNVAVTSYDIYRNGTKIGSASSYGYNDSGLTSGSTYSYTIVARDGAGNASAASGAGSVTTFNDTVPPLPPTTVLLYTRSDTSLVITWSAGSDPTGGSGIVGYDILLGGVLNTTVGNTSSATITGLAPATTYVITLKSVDGHGNRSVASLPLTARTSIDVTSPATPAAPTLATGGVTSLKLQWTAASDNVAVAGYHILRNSTVIAQVSSGTTFTDSGLSQNTAYTYAVRAYDASGNISYWSTSASFSTSADTITPSVPTNLTVTGTTQTTASLSWTASTDNVAIQNYLVFRGGVQVGTATGTTFTDTGLAAATTYAYTLKAQDEAGNLSAATSAVSATTTGNIAPTITTQPSNASVVVGTPVTFTVVATGTTPAYQWSRSNDGGTMWSLISGATTASYQLASPATTDNGARFRCVVSNSAGSVTSNVAILTVNALPTIALTGPADGAKIGTPATVTLTATAADADGTVTKVDFYAGSTLLGTDTTSPYTYTWTPANGTYALTAKATDNSGGVTTSTVHTVTVQTNVVPTVALTAPGAPFYEPASISLQAAASDSDGTITKVDFYNGTTLLGTKTTSPYTYTWTAVPIGTYSLTTKATDDSGGVGTSSVLSLSVVNAPPTVAITSPVSPANMVATDAITITATAADTNGTVSKVDFYQGTALLGTDTASPYTYVWANVPAGTYTLTAKATDNLGAVTTSAPVTLTSTANQAPTVATAASASSNPVTGTSTTLHVLSADDAGESALTYTWSTTGTPVPSFSANGSNAAKTTVATFMAAGSYPFVVTIKDARGLAVTSSVLVSVSATLASIVVSPASATVSIGSTTQFTANARDQFGVALSTQPTPLWSLSATTNGKSITTTGLFSAGTMPGGTVTVSAASGGKTGTALVTIPNAAPTVATAASASSGTVTGKTVSLSVLGADDGGEAALTYTWSTTTYPAPTFSANASNAAKSTTATFSRAGVYPFVVTITDALGLQVTSTVTVTVNTVPTSVAVLPATSTVLVGTTQAFAASTIDQFGAAVSSQPTYSWTLSDTTNGRSISSSGILTAGTAAGGPFTVTATGGGRSGTASVSMVTAFAPTVVIAALAAPSTVTGTTATLSVLGGDAGGEPGLIYTWATTGSVPAAVSFSPNASNASRSCIATFTKAGTYALQATIRNAGNQSVSSAVTVTVSAALTSVSLSPATASVTCGSAQQFTALAKDQFGTALAVQPTITWSIPTGYSLSSAGKFQADYVPTGPIVVTAETSGRFGTASVTVKSASVANGIALTPDASTVALGSTVQFRAVALAGGALPSPLTWTVNGGTISSQGLFSATTVGPFTVTVSGGSLNGSTSVAVVAPPSITMAAHAASQPATGRSVALSVAGKDALGSASLACNWKLVGNSPSGAGFSANNSIAAQNTQLAFVQAGTYHVVATLTDATGLQVSSPVDVVVAQTVTTLTLAPATVQLNPGGTQAFAVTALDQFELVMSLPAQPTWIATGGSVAATGIYTAGTTLGSAFTVTASSGGQHGTASITIGQVPVITHMASVSANPVTGTSVTASVQASDPLNGGSISYTWDVMSGPQAVEFSDNHSPSAGTTTVTFSQAGSYALRVTATAAGGFSTQSSVNVTVQSTYTALSIDQAIAAIVLAPASVTTFTATASDQFLQTMSAPTTPVWSISGGGSITTAGKLTAGAAGGPFDLVVTAGIITKAFFSVVTPATPPVQPTPPRITVAAKANPGTVTGQTATLSVTAVDDAGAAGLSYTWSQPEPGGGDLFSPNVSNAASTTVVTFNRSGDHFIRVTVTNRAGLKATSDVKVTVTDVLTSLTVAPGTQTVVLGSDGVFVARATNQFHATMPLPVLTWSCTNGNTIDSTGLFNALVAGSSTVTVTGGGLTANATARVASPPTIVSAAVASPATISGTTTSLTVVATDAAGESALTYTWSSDVIAVSFTPNGTNAAKHATATCSSAGSGQFTVVVTNAAGLSASSSVAVSLPAAVASIQVSVPTFIASGGHVQLSTTITDQFGDTVSPAPQPIWTVASGGSCDASGLFTALPTFTGTALVTATVGSIHGSANVVVWGVPTVTGISASLNGTSTGASLSLQATDPAGAAGLIYHWTAQAGSSAANLTYSTNYSNAASTATATFPTIPGATTYVITGTAINAHGFSAQKSATIVVPHILTRIYISTFVNQGQVPIGSQQQFSAQAQDQFYQPMAAPTIQWSVTGGGGIDQNGLYTAGSGASSPVVVTAAATGVPSATTQFSVSGHAPAFSTHATASPSTVLSTTTRLSALATAFGGGPLSYTWSAVPTAALVTDPAAADGHLATATFTSSGVYAITVAARDAQQSLTSTSTVVVTVNQTPVMSVIPAASTVPLGGTQYFSATVADQFGFTMPASTILALSGPGTLSTAGLYTAGTADGTTATITATATGLGASATATVTIADTPPVILVSAAALQNPATSLHNTLSVSADDDGGVGNLTYVWECLDQSLGPVIFSGNGATSANTVQVQVSHPGTYPLRVTVRDSKGQTATSDLSLIISMAFAAPSFSPANGVGAALGTLAVSILPGPGDGADAADARIWYTSGASPADPVPGQAGCLPYLQPIVMTASTTIAARRVRTASDGTVVLGAVAHSTYAVIDPTQYHAVSSGIGASGTPVSPLYMELDGATDGVTIRVAHDGIPCADVHVIGAQLAYANVPLAIGHATTVQSTVHGGSGADKVVTSTATWSATDVTGKAGETITLRRGDSLLLTASGSGVQEGIDAGLGSGPAYAAVGKPMPIAFPTSGNYTCTATIDDVTVGWMHIAVIDVPFATRPIDCEVNYQRTYKPTIQPGGQAANVFFTSADSAFLTVSTTSSDYDGAVLGLKPLQSGQPFLLARLGSTTGPVIACKEVSEFVIEGSNLDGLIFVPNDKRDPGKGGRGPLVVRTRPYVPQLNVSIKAAEAGSDIENFVVPQPIYRDGSAEPVGELQCTYTTGHSDALGFSATFSQIEPDPLNPANVVSYQVSSGTVVTAPLHTAMLYAANPADPSENTNGKYTAGSLGGPDVYGISKGIDTIFYDPANADYLYRGTLGVTISLSPASAVLQQCLSLYRGNQFSGTVLLGQSGAAPLHVNDALFASQDGRAYANLYTLVARPSTVDYQCQSIQYSLDLSQQSNANDEIGLDISGTSSWEKYEPTDTWHNIVEHFDPRPIVEVTAGSDGEATFPITILTKGGSGSNALGALDYSTYVTDPTQANGQREWDLVRMQPKNKAMLFSMSPGYLAFGSGNGEVDVRVDGIWTGGSSYGSLINGYSPGEDTDFTLQLSQLQERLSGTSPTTSLRFGRPYAGAPLTYTSVATNLGIPVATYNFNAYNNPAFNVSVKRSSDHLQVELNGNTLPDGQLTGSFAVGATTLQRDEYNNDILDTDISRFGINLSVQSNKNEDASAVIQGPGSAPRKFSLVSLKGTFGVPDSASAMTEAFPGHAWAQVGPGNLVFTVQTQRYATPALGPDVVLSYNSLDNIDNGLGSGWRTNYDMHIYFGKELDNGTYNRATLVDERGSVFLYSSDNAFGLNNDIYVPGPNYEASNVIPGSQIVLSRADRASGPERCQGAEVCKLIRNDDRLFFFDANGSLVRIRTIHGEELNVQRDAKSGFAIKVMDGYNRYQSLTRSTFGDSGTGSTPLAALNSGMSGSWAFKYDARGNMNMITLNGTFSGSSSLVYGMHYDQKTDQITSIDYPAVNGTAFTKTITEVDAYNHIWEVTEPLGGKSTITVVGDMASSIKDAMGVTRQRHFISGRHVEASWTGKEEFDTGVRYDSTKVRFPIQSIYDPRERLIGENVYGSSGIEQATTWSYAPLASAYGSDGTCAMPAEYRIQSVSGIDGSASPDLVTSYTYETSGRKSGLLRSKTDPTGAVTTYTYTDDARLTAIADARGNVWKFENFDAYGQPQTTMSPEGIVTTKTYGQDGTVLTVTDAKSQDKTTFVYDAQQRVKSRQFNALPAELTTYDPLGRVLSTTDVMSRSVTYGYDAWGRQTQVSDSTGSVAPILTTYARDPNNTSQWVVTTTKGPERISQSIVDLAGRIVNDVTQRYLVHGAASAMDCTTHHEYDPVFGYETKFTDAAMFVTQYDHDTQGRVITVTGPTTAAANPVTRTTYNGLGWPLTVTDPDGHISSVGYASDGQIALQVNPAGGTVRYGYDATGNCVSVQASFGAPKTFEYDRDGVQVARVDQVGRRHTVDVDRSARTITTRTDNLAAQTTIAHVDARGYADTMTTVLGTTTLQHRNDGVTSNVAMTGRNPVAIGLDALSRTTSISQIVPLVSDPNHVSQFKLTFDPLTGRRTSTLDPAQHLVKPIHNDQTGEDYGISDNGNSGSLTATAPVRQLLDQDQNGYPHIYLDALNRQVIETHDPLGRILTRNMPSGESLSWTYSPAGFMTSSVRMLIPTTYTSNALGQAISTSVPGRAAQTAVYDCLGTLLSRSDGLTTTTYSYDPVTRQLLSTVDSSGRSKTYGHDARGRTTTIKDNRGQGQQFDFDDLDRYTRITHADGKKEEFEYDATGQLKRRTDRAGRSVLFAYDASGRLTSKFLSATAATVSYDLDMPASGGLVASTTLGSASSIRVQDVRGRLTSLTLPGSAPVAFSYNAGDQVQTRGPISYTYDGHGRPWQISGPGGSVTLTYDGNGRLQGLALPNGVTRGFTYDGSGAIGGLTQVVGSVNENWVVTRDAQGRISHLTGPAGLAISYLYDASGRLAQETRSGDLPLLIQHAYDGADNRTDTVTFASPSVKQDAFGSAIGSEVTPPAASSGTWSIVSGALSATAAADTTSAVLKLATAPAVGGPSLTVTVKPSLPVATAGAISGAGIALTSSDGSIYRAVWQLTPPPAGQFSPPAAEGRLAVEHVTTAGVVTLTDATDWVADDGSAKVLSLTVWPDQRMTTTTVVAAGQLRLDTAIPGIGSATSLTSALTVAAEGGPHGAATFDNLSWTSAASRTTRHATFDAFNTLTNEDVTSTDSAQDGRHRTFAFNAQGQMVTRSLAVGTGTAAVEASYAFDEFDRMTSSTVGSQTSRFSYYGDSWMRASMVVGSMTTTWTYDGSQLLSQSLNDGTNPTFVTTYVHHDGVALWENDANGGRVYAYDPVGNVRGQIGKLTDGTTTGMAYLQQYDYDAFGTIQREQVGAINASTHAFGLAPASLISSGLRAKGMWLDGGLNLYKTQTRSYAPDLARFTQLDPAKQGQNWYSYCGGDPVNRMDPTGLKWLLMRTNDGFQPYWQADPSDFDPVDSGQARMFTVPDLLAAANRLAGDPNLPNTEIGKQDFAHLQPAFNINAGGLPPYIQDDRLAAPLLNYIPLNGKQVDITYGDLEQISSEYMAANDKLESSRHMVAAGVILAPAALYAGTAAASYAIAYPFLAAVKAGTVGTVVGTATLAAVRNPLEQPQNLSAFAPAQAEEQWLFRGTTEGYAGSPGLQRAAVTPTSTNPAIATAFGVESSQYGQGVLQVGRGSALPTIPGNVLAGLESEVGVDLSPLAFAARAHVTISVQQARTILAQMGIDVPVSLASKRSLTAAVETTQVMTPAQISEFVRRAEALAAASQNVPAP